MNLINKICKASAALMAVTLLVSCNKFLDKPPLTSLNDNNYWKNEKEVQLYCNGFYSEINGGGTVRASTLFSNGGVGSESDFYFPSFSDDQASQGDNFAVSAGANANTWSTPYAYIRLATLLLERIDKVPGLTQAAANNYKGFAYYWMAEEYYDLVRHYGDVPFVNKYLDQSQDSSTIWGPRVARDKVMDSVLTYINFAVANLYPKSVADAAQGLGPNTINQDVANAMKSRICLFEGSWAKYHENNSNRAQQYFQASQTASEALMNGGNYQLAADYGTTYHTNHTTSTGGMSTGGEIILFRKYATGQLSNSVFQYATSATTPASAGLTKDAVDAFLLTDGNPISVQGGDPLYQGDVAGANLSIANTVLANRDKRLVETVWPALAVIGHPGNITGGNPSTTGYAIQRFTPLGFSPTVPTIDASQNDYPVFWYPEILLNEAEATAELGTFTQTTANATINLLRARAGVAPLNVSNIPVDLKRDPDVSPLLWEVRRERRVELMLTSFRYWDLRRWGKLSYLDPATKPDIFLGANLTGTGLNNHVDANGYISASTPNRTIDLIRDYLDFIPTSQVQMYQNAGITFPQNPNW